MSESAVIAPQSAPEAAPAPAAPARVTRADLQNRLANAANDVFAKPAPKAEEAPAVPGEQPPVAASAQPEAVAEAVAALEETGKEVPNQKPQETNAQYASRLASLTLKYQSKEAESLNHKTRADSAEAKVKELEARFEEVSKDPVKALKLANKTPDELAEMMLNGELTKAEEKVVKQELSPELKEIVEEHARMKAERQAEAEKAAAAKLRTEQVKIVEGAKAAHVEQFPILAIMPSEQLLDTYQMATANNGGEEPDFAKFVAEAQAEYVRGAVEMIKSEGVLNLMLQDATVKEALIKALKLAPAPAASATARPTAEVAPTLTNAGTSTVPVPNDEKITEQERKRRAKAAADSIFGK